MNRFCMFLFPVAHDADADRPVKCHSDLSERIKDEVRYSPQREQKRQTIVISYDNISFSSH